MTCTAKYLPQNRELANMIQTHFCSNLSAHYFTEVCLASWLLLLALGWDHLLPLTQDNTETLHTKTSQGLLLSSTFPWKTAPQTLTISTQKVAEMSL